MSMRRTYPNQVAYGTTKTQEMLEQENDQMVESLKDKVNTLKTLSIDIGDEVRGQNVLLKDMGTDFDSTGGLLSGTMKRLKGLAQGGHNNWMCYMILLIVFVFLILFYVIKWRQ